MNYIYNLFMIGMHVCADIIIIRSSIALYAFMEQII